MGYGLPSTTTAPGRPPSRVGARHAGARLAPALLTALAVIALAAAAFLTAGCSDSENITSVSGDKLTPGVTYSAELDGDRPPEQILIDAGRLIITDGDTVYRSRDKWQVVEACFGDTDHNGALEVVTLLDAEDGRHLGLFAHFGGEYRERLVTQELSPRPLSLEVISFEDAAEDPEITPFGDLILLTEEPAPGQTGSRTITYRWNGFGFTAL
jgi:hypothetical protein